MGPKVEVACAGILVALLGVGCQQQKERARHSACLTHNKQIGLACQIYASDHRGDFPAEFGQLFPKYVAEADAFICPVAGNAEPITHSDLREAAVDASGALTPEHTDYVYVSGLRPSMPPDLILAFDREGNHLATGGRHVLFVGGVVEAVDEGAFSAAIARTVEYLELGVEPDPLRSSGAWRLVLGLGSAALILALFLGRRVLAWLLATRLRMAATAAATLLAVQMILVARTPPHGGTPDHRCRRNVRYLGHVCHLYANAHARSFPPSLGALIPDYVDGTYLCCPVADREKEPILKQHLPPGAKDAADILSAANTDFVYLRGLAPDDPADWVLAFDRAANHVDGRNVVRVGGEVCWTEEADFAPALARTFERLKTRVSAKSPACP